MKKNSVQKWIRIICLLFTVGILSIQPVFTVRASELTDQGEHRTAIQEAGAAETPDELAEMNISSLNITLGEDGNGQLNSSLRILITLTLIALAPMLVICLTSFTRIIIVLHFTRSALNTQTAPPNQILIGLALFLTFFIMTPTLTEVYSEAVIPFESGELTQEEALEAGIAPFREFMYGQTKIKDVQLFMDIARMNWDGEDLASIPTSVLVPAFMIGELRYAFLIGFLIYIPFIVIDMVVASTLMSMGMMMLPPTTISMPFKILLFVMADGWSLIIGVLVKTFYD